MLTNDQPEDPRTLGILERARGGDGAAYDELFSYVADRALLFIRIRLGAGLRQKLEPMDVLQEAYLDAFQSIARFDYRGPGSFARWICRIIENRIRGQADHFGARKRQPPGGLMHVSEVLDRARAHGTGPATAFRRLDTRERLSEAMGQLDEAERQALLLRFFQERTIDEIAEDMGKSPSAVGRLLGKATARLGVLMRPAEPPPQS